MTKKEFEKETYLAPEWGLRVVRVERNILGESDDSSDNGYDNGNDMGEIGGDE